MTMPKRFVSAAAVAGIVFVLAGILGASAPGDAENALAATKQAWEVEFQKLNPEKWVDFYADDAVIEDLGAGDAGKKVHGRAEILAWFKQVAASWPDSTYHPVRILQQGNSTVIEWHWVGRQKQPFLGAPATEKSVNLRGITIWDFENGKVKREVSLYNFATIRAQLEEARQ